MGVLTGVLGQGWEPWWDPRQEEAMANNPSTSSSMAMPIPWYEFTIVVIYCVWWIMDVDVLMPGFLARVCE